jgi:asparagine synthase (glutamine-hydrolysing)
MASSVEVRVPLLDRELVEFSMQSIPSNLKIRGRLRPTTKYILRKALNGSVPTQVLRAKKAGFGAPISGWLRTSMRPMAEDLLAPDVINRRGLFRADVVGSLLQDHLSGRADRAFQIWQLVVLELWMQTFLDAGERRWAAHAG